MLEEVNVGRRDAASFSAAPPEPRTVSGTLSALADHSRGRRLALRSKRIFIHNLQISILVAGWTVLLALPIIVWPLGEYLWDFKCHGKEAVDCLLSKECLWQHTFFWNGECVSRRSGYLSLWGTMILQFLYSVYADYGSTVKFTVQGVVGTMLAWANMTFLNRCLGFWLHGGAFHNRLAVQGSWERVNSQWLPLCTDGFHILVESDTFCVFNIWLHEISWSGFAMTLVVWIDFVLFVAACLAVGFDNNTRMFALTAHVYFVMSFVDPSRDDFDEWPPMYWDYLCMVMFASFAAVICFRFPKRRFTALEAAEELTGEASSAVGLLVEAAQGVTTALMRQKAGSALMETEVVLADLEAKLESSWFEDFGFGSTAHRRRRLRRWAACLRSCTSHMPSVYHAATALRPVDTPILDEMAPALREACAAVRDLIVRGPGSAGLGQGWDDEFTQLEVVAKECAARAAESFHEHRPRLSAEAHGFLFTVYGAAADARQAVSEFQRWQESSRSNRPTDCRSFCHRCVHVAHTVRKHFGIELFDRSATHPRFVLRNTFSISLAFTIGWLGIWNVLPAYSSYPASTICVVVYTYTGSSAPVTIQRVAGVVLGKVMGTILQLSFACTEWWRVLVFGLSMFSVVCFMFFLYLHSDRDVAYVCCLTGAFAASSMIPGSFKLRECRAEDFEHIAPALLNTIFSTVIGVGILTVVDLLFGSKATNQARQRLLRAIEGAQALLVSTCGGSCLREDVPLDAALLKEDLDALRAVLPYASAEPAYWRRPFKSDLYDHLERHLRTVCAHLETLARAMRRLRDERPPPPAAASAGGAPLLGEGGPSAPGPAAQLTEADFQPVLQRVRRELWAMLDDVGRLSAAVTASEPQQRQRSAGDEEDGAREVRQQLEANLYTVRAVRLVASGASAAIGWATRGLLPQGRASPRPLGTMAASAGPPPQAAVPGPGRGGNDGAAGASREPGEAHLQASEGGGGLLGYMRRLRSQVVHERLHSWRPFREAMQTPGDEEVATSGFDASGVAGRLSLEELFEGLRSEAAAQSLSEPHPQCDDLCRVELIVLLVNSIVIEVGKMQLALLEY